MFLELVRRDYKVHIGKVGEYEVDFVAEKPSERLYIQVTESMNNADVRDRELRSFNSIKDNYEKIVLSMDKSYISSYDGVKVLNVIEFVSVEFKTVIIVYMTLISIFFSTNIWIKNNIMFHSNKYGKYLTLLPLIIYFIASTFNSKLLVKYVDMELDEILNILYYVMMVLAFIVIFYAMGNKNNIEKGFARIHYRLSLLCLNYIYSFEYDRVDEFNEKCVLIEKMSITCLEIKLLYTEDEVKFINSVLDEIKALVSSKRKYRDIDKYIDWLRKELDNQTRLV